MHPLSPFLCTSFPSTMIHPVVMHIGWGGGGPQQSGQLQYDLDSVFLDRFILKHTTFQTSHKLNHPLAFLIPREGSP